MQLLNKIFKLLNINIDPQFQQFVLKFFRYSAIP